MDSTTEVPEAKRRKIDEGTDNNVTSTPEINPAALPPMDKHDQAVKLSVRGSAAAAAKRSLLFPEVFPLTLILVFRH